MGPANLYADLVKAWIEQDDPERLDIHIEIATLHQPVPFTAYILVFDTVQERGPKTFYAGAIIFDKPRFLSSEWDRVDRVPMGEAEIAGALELGSSARITLSVPVKSLGSQVTALENLELLALDYNPQAVGARMLVLDDAIGERGFTLMPRLDAGGASMSQAAEDVERTVPAPGVALAIAGILVATGRHRRG